MNRLFAGLLALLAMPGFALADGGAITTTKLLETSVTNTGAPIAYPATDAPQITVAIVEIPVGASTPVHLHPNLMVAYLLQGTLEVTAEDGTVNVYKEGDALVEALDQNHQGRTIGDTPVRVLITVMGVAGEPVSVTEE